MFIIICNLNTCDYKNRSSSETFSLHKINCMITTMDDSAKYALLILCALWIGSNADSSQQGTCIRNKKKYCIDKCSKAKKLDAESKKECLNEVFDYVAEVYDEGGVPCLKANGYDPCTPVYINYNPKGPDKANKVFKCAKSCIKRECKFCGLGGISKGLTLKQCALSYVAKNPPPDYPGCVRRKG